jgi:hypothetical protein
VHARRGAWTWTPGGGADCRGAFTAGRRGECGGAGGTGRIVMNRDRKLPSPLGRLGSLVCVHTYIHGLGRLGRMEHRSTSFLHQTLGRAMAPAASETTASLIIHKNHEVP